MDAIKYVYRIDDDDELYYSEREVLDYIYEIIFDEKDYILKKSDFSIYRYKQIEDDIIFDSVFTLPDD